jgi:hypothetical protein
MLSETYTLVISKADFNLFTSLPDCELFAVDEHEGSTYILGDVYVCEADGVFWLAVDAG